MESLSDQKLNNLVLGLDPAIPQFELSMEATAKFHTQNPVIQLSE